MGELADFNDLIGRIGVLEDEIERETDNAVEEGLEETQRGAIAELGMPTRYGQPTTWRGELASNIRVHRSPEPEWDWELVVNADHGVFVEFGTGDYFGGSQFPLPDNVSGGDSPGYSPELRESIEQWVRTKPVVPRNPQYSQSELVDLISGLIATHGTRSQPYLRPAWFIEKPRLVDGVGDGIEKAMRKASRG